ncbi:MAG: hypothetical protein WCC71_22670, partial [Candidatus Sulfotelmatobacter sp.]
MSVAERGGEIPQTLKPDCPIWFLMARLKPRPFKTKPSPYRSAEALRHPKPDSSKCGAEGPLFHGSAGGGGRGRVLPFLLLAIVVLLSATGVAQTGKYPQTIVFMTDFGVVDDSVALCRG